MFSGSAFFLSGHNDFLPNRDEWPGSYFEKYLFIILLLGVNVLQRTLFLCHFPVDGKCSLWALVVDVESGDSVAERERVMVPYSVQDKGTRLIIELHIAFFSPLSILNDTM